MTFSSTQYQPAILPQELGLRPFESDTCIEFLYVLPHPRLQGKQLSRGKQSNKTQKVNDQISIKIKQVLQRSE